MKSYALLFGCAFLLLLGFLEHATLRGDDVTGLVTFTAGTVARADEANANFDEIRVSVNDNDQRIVQLESATHQGRITFLAHALARST